MIDLTNRVVLVTGAAGGIGAATARALAAAGARVALHDLDPGRTGELAEELGDAVALSADLADPRNATRLWSEAVEWQGRVDVLVNNAGIYEPADPEGELDAWVESWQRTLGVCLVSPATLCR